MLKIMMIALAAVLLVLIPVRCYQYASGVIEPTTGFYSGSDWSIWLSYILLAVSAVAFLAIAIASRKKISYSTEKFGSTGLAIAAFMFALTLMIDAVSQYKTVFATATDTALMYGTESVQYLKTGLVSRGLEGFCAVVAAVLRPLRLRSLKRQVKRLGVKAHGAVPGALVHLQTHAPLHAHDKFPQRFRSSL